MSDKDSDELYSLLIPLNDGRLIVPRVCVAEVIRYLNPEEPADGPAWFQGSVDWNGRTIPVVSFESMCEQGRPEISGRTRIVVFNPMDTESGSHYGILTEGFPQLVRVNSEVLEPDEEQNWPSQAPVLCRVRMINEFPLIPDLEGVERLLREWVLKAPVPAV